MLYSLICITATTTYSDHIDRPATCSELMVGFRVFADSFSTPLFVVIAVATSVFISASLRLAFFFSSHHVRQQGRPLSNTIHSTSAAGVFLDSVDSQSRWPVTLLCLQFTRVLRPTLGRSGQVRRFADVTSPDAPIVAAGVSTEPGTSAHNYHNTTAHHAPSPPPPTHPNTHIITTHLPSNQPHSAHCHPSVCPVSLASGV